MLKSRMFIILEAKFYLSRALLVALRYSVVRR